MDEKTPLAESKAPSFRQLPPPSIGAMNATPAPAAVGIPVGNKPAAPVSVISEPDLSAESRDEDDLAAWLRSLFWDSVKFPWRKDGWTIVIPGAILGLLVGLGSFAPLFGFFPITLGVGYFGALYLDIIATTIAGKEEPPDWPEISNLYEDIVLPGLRLVGITFISFAPQLIFIAVAKPDHMPYFSSLVINVWGDFPWLEGTITKLLNLLGCAYFPMACIAVVMAGSLSAALPHRVIPAIQRCLPEYALAVLCLLGARFFARGIEVGALFLSPFVQAVAGSLAAFFLLIIQARITGLTCRRFRERIAWG